jgi:pimeloyl-ACP methyl ester carboxylesterase
MDSRCLSLFLKYALRDMANGGVTLSTPKAQEAWSYVRSNFCALSPDTPEGRCRERMLNPDLAPGSDVAKVLTNRPELLPICDGLPHLRPRAFYLYGEYSHINFDEVREYHMTSTGTGRGGNGGVEEGGVREEVLEDCGHLCVFEKPAVIAKSVGRWLAREVVRWTEEKEYWDKASTEKSKNERTELSEKWIEVVKLDAETERAAFSGKAKL